MPSAPALTFAVPYYSRPDYLRLAVRSVFDQTLPDWRLLVLDDSPDGSAAGVMAEFADPRTSYVRNPRTLGLAGNWNRGLELADTPLVTLLHADDELRPTYAATMTAAADAHPTAALLFCRAAVVGPAGEPVFSVPDRVKRVLAPDRRPIRVSGPAGLARLLRGNFIMCPTVCYRRAAVGERRFDPRWRFVLDLDFFARLLADGAAFVGVPAECYRYRRHPGNVTAALTENLDRFREEAALYDELADHATAAGWADVARVGRRKAILHLHLLFRVVQDAAGGRLRAAATKARFLPELRRSPRRQPCAT